MADGPASSGALLVPVGGLVPLLRDHCLDAAFAQVDAVAAGGVGLVPGGRARPGAGTADEAADPCLRLLGRGPSPRCFRDQALQQDLEDARVTSLPEGLCAVDQAPNSSGISRHCPPVLNRRITPSNCCRSRSGYGPYSPIGRYGSMNFH